MLSALSVLSQIVLGGPKRTFATSSGNSIKDTCHGLRVKALIFKQLKLSERADVSLQIIDTDMDVFRRTEIGDSSGVSMSANHIHEDSVQLHQ